MVESHLIFSPCVADSRVSFVCFGLMSNHHVKLYSWIINSFPLEKENVLVLKNACCHAQNPSLNGFYRGVIACIIDFRITLKRFVGKLYDAGQILLGALREY